MNYAQLISKPKGRTQGRKMIAEAKKIESTLGSTIKDFEQWVLDSEDDDKSYEEIFDLYESRFKDKLCRMNLKWFAVDWDYFERAYGCEKGA